MKTRREYQAVPKCAVGSLPASIPHPWVPQQALGSPRSLSAGVAVAVHGGARGTFWGSLCWPGVAPHPPASPHPRHLFAIANVAYSKVMDAKHNQCIVIRWDMAVPTHSSLINTTLIAGSLPPAWGWCWWEFGEVWGRQRLFGW